MAVVIYAPHKDGLHDGSIQKQTMAFIKKQFKQEIERPYTQVQSVVAVWQQFVPTELAAHCRLDSLRRGVLKVAVNSSEHLYELDRLLRDGLAEKITRAHGGELRRIQLVLRGE